MNDMELSKKYVNQGLMYLYRDDTICRLRFTAAEELDIEIMNLAVNEALNLHPYYRTTFVEEDNQFFSLRQFEQYQVLDKYEQKTLPQKEGGYLFQVFCIGKDLIFDYHHALADGRGILPFILEIYRLYLNKKIGLNIPGIELKEIEECDYESIVKQYYVDEKEHEKWQRRKGKNIGEKYCIIIPYDEIKKKSMKLEIRPFATVVTMISELFKDKSEDGIHYRYSLDTRGTLRVEGAIYNCSVSSDRKLDNTKSFQDRAIEAENIVIEDKKQDNILKKLARIYKWLLEMDAMKVSVNRKKRVIQMNDEIDNDYDFWVSYAGDFFYGVSEEIKKHIVNWKMEVPPSMKSIMGVEVYRIREDMVFCIDDHFSEENHKYVVKNIWEKLGFSVKLETSAFEDLD